MPGRTTQAGLRARRRSRLVCGQTPKPPSSARPRSHPHTTGRSHATPPRPTLLLRPQDLDAVEALVQGLALFKGGVLMVSHDQHLIESTVDELWAVEGGTVSVFRGTFDDYKKRLRSL